MGGLLFKTELACVCVACTSMSSLEWKRFTHFVYSLPFHNPGQLSGCDKSQPIYPSLFFFTFDFNVISVTSLHLLFPSRNPTQPTDESMKWAQDWKMEVRLEHLPKNRLPSAHTIIVSHRNSTEVWKGFNYETTVSSGEEVACISDAVGRNVRVNHALTGK